MSLIKVSVVVPVYNAGDLIETGLASLLAQTLPAEELEIVYVDDGSTDDSLARLRAAEAAYEQVRVLTIPNSGWPGRPRNVGTDAALGEYVMYVDQDDKLGRDALRRMHELGSTNGADVVLGKVISDFRGVHLELYRESKARCTVHDTWLMGSQTAHKMVRTAFLREQGIRFAEGRRRLEDQLFITQAYLAAASCAIEADYVCYRYLRRPGGGNTGATLFHPPDYYASLEDVLDVIDRHCPPGEERDRFYRRFLRTEILARFGGGQLPTGGPDYQRAKLTAARDLVLRRFPLSVDAGLPPLLKVRADLVRHGTIGDLEQLADRVRRLKPVVTLHTAVASAGPHPTVELDVGVEFWQGDEPLVIEEGGYLPQLLTGATVTEDQRRLEPEGEFRADAVIRHRKSRDDWFVPGDWRLERVGVEGGTRLQWRGLIRLDPASVAGGRAARIGYHDLVVRVSALGVSRSPRIPAAPALDPIELNHRRREVLVYASRSGKLSVRVRRAPVRVQAATPAPPRRTARTTGRSRLARRLRRLKRLLRSLRS